MTLEIMLQKDQFPGPEQWHRGRNSVFRDCIFLWQSMFLSFDASMGRQDRESGFSLETLCFDMETWLIGARKKTLLPTDKRVLKVVQKKLNFEETQKSPQS